LIPTRQALLASAAIVRADGKIVKLENRRNDDFL